MRGGVFVAIAACSSLAFAAQRPTAGKDEPPAPEDIVLTTKDGVELVATWYASTAGKNAAPIILLHGFQGSRGDWADFAAYLQRDFNHAVIVPDLRGHGGSTVLVTPEGSQREMSASRLRPDDFTRMAQQDVEAVKRFLNDRNNAGEVNIERLGIVGAEMGALVAAEWAHDDWAFDRLPSIKQGRDVKALALISPEVRFKTLEVAALTEPPIEGQIGLQIIAGAKNPKAERSARQVYNLVRRFYHDPPDDAPPEEVLQNKKLFLDIGYDTTLQGAKMLGERLGLEERIARFLELQLVNPELPWRERKSPL